jgi:hypothetical protein
VEAAVPTTDAAAGPGLHGLAPVVAAAVPSRPPDFNKVRQLLRQARELSDKQAKVLESGGRSLHLQAAIAVLRAAALELEAPTDPASCQAAWEQLHDINVQPPKPPAQSPEELARLLVQEGLTDSALLRGERGLRYFGHFGLTPDNQYMVQDAVEAILHG